LNGFGSKYTHNANKDVSEYEAAQKDPRNNVNINDGAIDFLCQIGGDIQPIIEC
jgi:hypothetical protein